MDSGLIFPIIVALWLAFLVPHWIRRREQLSASRSVDRFSAAMRVLSRRDEPAVARRPASTAYVLKPPREDVHDLVAAGHLSVDRDLVVKRARPVDTAPTRQLAPALVSPLDLTPRDLALRARPPRVLAALLLLALVATPGTAVLAALAVVAPWAPVTSLLVGALTVTGLRRRALRRREARRRALVAARRTAAPAAGRRPAAAERTVPTVEPDVVAETLEVPGSWTPVPVPPPVYTLKPAATTRPVLPWEAERPAVPELAVAVRRVVPDLDLVLERRRAAG